MFELLTAAQAKFRNVEVLSQKNRAPGENPGVKLSLELTLSNHCLSMFDGFLVGTLFQKASGGESTQSGLDGVEAVSDMPVLSNIGKHVGCVPWAQELTGYAAEIVLGIATERSNLALSDCKLHTFRFLPKEGGTVLLRCTLESPSVNAAQWGQFAGLKGRDAELLLRAPEVVQQDIEQPAPSRGRRSKGNGAGAAAH